MLGKLFDWMFDGERALNLICPEIVPQQFLGEDAFAEPFVAVDVADVVVAVEEEAEQNELFSAGKTGAVVVAVVGVAYAAVTQVVPYCGSSAKWTLKGVDKGFVADFDVVALVAAVEEECSLDFSVAVAVAVVAVAVAGENAVQFVE